MGCSEYFKTTMLLGAMEPEPWTTAESFSLKGAGIGRVDAQPPRKLKFPPGAIAGEPQGHTPNIHPPRACTSLSPPPSASAGHARPLASCADGRPHPHPHLLTRERVHPERGATPSPRVSATRQNPNPPRLNPNYSGHPREGSC